MTFTIWQIFIILILISLLILIIENRSIILDWIFKNNDEIFNNDESISLDFYNQQKIENANKLFDMVEVDNFSNIEELTNILFRINEDHDLVAVLNFNGILSLATISIGLLEVDTILSLKELMNTFSKYEKFDVKVYADDIICNQIKIKKDIKLSFLTPLSSKMELLLLWYRFHRK